MNIIRDVYDAITRRVNPIKYWRRKGAQIGENCDINSSVAIISEPYLVKLGNNVRISAGVKFITHDGGVWVCRNMDTSLSDIDIFGNIQIGNNVHIGTNAVIMPGAKIGNNCIIGCGAVVVKEIPDNSVAVGVPARKIKTISEYIDKNCSKFVRTKHLSYAEKKKFLLNE